MNQAHAPIPFSPPDITEQEIEEVVSVLRSGWITTGPKTKEFEEALADFCGTRQFLAVNSATAALEMALRALQIGPGDEVITTAYTFTATASVVLHVGAKLVLVDTLPDCYEMDPIALEQAITSRTKAIIAVDLGGAMCDYPSLIALAEKKRGLFSPSGPLQEALGRIAVLADAAHSLGAQRVGLRSGQGADMSSFSFHAVKNLTTGEGGGLTCRPDFPVDQESLFRSIRVSCLHGQTKSALEKTRMGSWEYDIVEPGFKCNLTDIASALGLAQLRRYPAMLQRRKEIIALYNQFFSDSERFSFLAHQGAGFSSSGHLYLLRVKGYGQRERERLISYMTQHQVAVNVHYKPLPLLTAYQKLGFSIQNYPNAYALYENEITLPLHTLLSDESVEHVAQTLLKGVEQMR